MLSVDRWAEGRVSDGFLGCPVCHARYEIREGVADFTNGERRDDSHRQPEVTGPDGLRLAAQLDLSEGGGLVMLTAGYSMLVPALNERVQATYLIVSSYSASPGSPQEVSIRLLDRIPLVDGALRAAAIDASHASARFLSEVARCVRDGGRIVAPADSPPPANARVLARDEREWVAKVEKLTPLVMPRRTVHR